MHLVTQEFNSVNVSENASETQIDTTMAFTEFIASIEQNEEFQESRVHCTLAGIKSLLKIGGRFLGTRGGLPKPLEPSPGYAPEKGHVTMLSILDNDSEEQDFSYYC